MPQGTLTDSTSLLEETNLLEKYTPIVPIDILDIFVLPEKTHKNKLRVLILSPCTMKHKQTYPWYLAGMQDV